MQPDHTVVAAAHLAGNAPITLNRVGRRVYIYGNTYPIRNDLKGLGAKWDRDERAWWVSTTRYRKNQQVFDNLSGTSPEPRATQKQVDYLLRLHNNLGKRVNPRELEQLTMAEASALINKMKSERGSTAPSHSRARPSSGRGPLATDRQVRYVMRLLQRDPRAWFDTIYGDGAPMPTREDLAEFTRQEISDLIEDLK